MSLVSLDEAKNYLRVDIDEDDSLISMMLQSAEQHLKNATGYTYEDTEKQYAQEKLYILLLVGYWYENRSAGANARSFNGGKIPDEFTYATRSLLLQLQMGGD